MKKLKDMILRFYQNDVIRYVFFGGCTTLVNLVCFFVLRKCGLELNIANLISIITAILFAYVVNSRFVFQDKCETLRDHFRHLQIYQRAPCDNGDRGRRCVAPCRSLQNERHGGKIHHTVYRSRFKLHIQQVFCFYNRKKIIWS